MKSCVNLEGRDICLETGEGFKSIRILGIFELVLGFFTTAIGGTQLRSLFVGEPFSKMQLVGGLLLTLFSVVLTLADFFVFTLDLSEEQTNLFNALEGAEEGITWCAYDVSYYRAKCFASDVTQVNGADESG